jgi:hypothetical protein
VSALHLKQMEQMMLPENGGSNDDNVPAAYDSDGDYNGARPFDEDQVRVGSK